MFQVRKKISNDIAISFSENELGYDKNMRVVIINYDFQQEFNLRFPSHWRGKTLDEFVDVQSRIKYNPNEINFHKYETPHIYKGKSKKDNYLCLLTKNIQGQIKLQDFIDVLLLNYLQSYMYMKSTGKWFSEDKHEDGDINELTKQDLSVLYRYSFVEKSISNTQVKTDEIRIENLANKKRMQWGK